MTKRAATAALQEILDREIFEAVLARVPNRVELCLQKGANVDARSSAQATPLMLAVIAADRPSIGVLISAGADLSLKNDKGEDVFLLARNIQKYDVRQAVLDTLLKALPAGIDTELGEDFDRAALRKEADKDIEAIPPVTFKKKPTAKPGGGGFNL